MNKKIAVLIGSASKTSFNYLVVKHLQKIAPAHLQFSIVEIGDLPLYDRDLDEKDIPEYTRVREAVKAADAVLWVSPEHNGGVSAMLKNAIDVVSRPMGQSQWIGKPLGIMTVAAGVSGGVRVSDNLRVLASAPFINMPTAPFAANIGGIFNGVFNDQGDIVSEQVKTMLQGFITAYAEFIQKF